MSGRVRDEDMAGILYPEQEPGVLAPATVNPLLLRQVQAQRASNPRPNVTDLFGYGPDLNSYASNLSRNFAGQFEGLGTPQNFMGPFGFGGITAFHGSPHKFDKFDMSKVGTGEGAQAYGHGLYFAENPQVAKNYAPRDFDYEDRLMKMYKQAETRRDYDSMEVLESAMLHQTPSELRAQYPKAGALIDQVAAEQSKAKFNLYKVDIPDDQVAKMMDWDKPISQQPEGVRKALEAMDVPLFRAWQKNGAWEHVTAETLYRQLAGGMTYGAAEKGLHAKASQMLKDAGIPGIRYLDQGSRSGGKGTSNFVVFDDQIPKIIGRE
jgi:hypothetical protein